MRGKRKEERGKGWRPEAWKALALLALALVALPVVAQAPAAAVKTAPSPRIEVLVLGTFHMANPGHDIFNSKADDVLAPRRQAEIAELAAALEKFHPTKVAVEGDVFGDRIATAYADYLAGKHELTRNETEQIGFRVARELGHSRIYPVDVDGEFPYPRVVSFAKASGRTKELDTIMGGFGEMSKAQNDFLASHTILQTLLYVNADDKDLRNEQLYAQLAQVGEPGDWAGADLVADWTRRNLRIYSNIVHIADAPGDRILVIYGAGHLAWLRDMLAANPDVRLRKLEEFAPKTAAGR